MFQSTIRPQPEHRDRLTRDELLALRCFPPAAGARPARMALRDGRHFSPARGRGMEFDDLRLYQPGDDIRQLDWRLLARTGELHTRLYREERERPVFLLLDMSATMQFASQGHFKSLLAAYAAALVGWAAQRAGDRVGGQIIHADGSSTLRKPVSARQGVAGLIAAMAAAVGAEGKQSAGLLAALQQAEKLLPSGTQLYLFSDFRDLNPALIKLIQRLARRCELQLVLLSDPLERALPLKQSLSFQHGEQRIRLPAQDAATREAYAQRFAERLQAFEALGRTPNVSVHHWSTDNHPLFDQEVAGE